MNYLGNDRNIVRPAALVGTNTIASDVVYRTDEVEKVGGGDVTLTGSYTGANDAVFDVEIVDTSSVTPRVSAPVFTGVGNGALSGLAVTGLAAQQFVVTLEDLGTETRKAFSPFQSASLRARVAGDDGNLITLTIDASELVDTISQFSLPEDLRADANEYVGDAWNFGAPNINPIEGTIPLTAPRLRFGFDPQVYRQYRTWDGTQYVYSFSPAPLRDLDAGTVVYNVTGSRTITITDGTDTDTLENIITVYDCLSAIRDQSTLVEVDGAIVNDLQPNGQGMTELSVWTQPYITSLVRDGTTFVQDADIELELASIVPTEKLTIRCKDTRRPGDEVWSVRGDVSGSLTEAVTGIEYTSAGYTFTIPRVNDGTGEDRGSIRIQYNRPGWDGITQLPLFTPTNAVLGIGAYNTALSFIYAPRPFAECEELGDLVGGPNAACLGLTPPGGTPVSDASLLRRTNELAAYRRLFMQSNTGTPPSSSLSSVDQDLTFNARAIQVLAAGLEELGSADAVLIPPAHAVSTAYAVDVIVSAVVSGVTYRFAADVAGTTSGTPPTWTATLNATYTDGSVTWRNIGKTAIGIWDDSFALLQADANELQGMTRAGVVPAVYVVLTAVALKHVVSVEVNGVDTFFEVTTAGTTGATAPDWSTALDIGDTKTDGTVTWTRIGGDSTEVAAERIDELYYLRYESQMGEAMAAAGLAPNFDPASGQGDGCWQDEETEFWWAFNGDEPRAPIFTGIYYHSSMLEQQEDGSTTARSTKEFGFGPRFGCPELIEPGDQLVITIDGVGGVQTYEQGDVIVVQTTRASPLEFGGGQTGDDTLKFSVVGSVTGRLPNYELLTTGLAAYTGTVAAWAAATVYTLGQQRRPVVRNGKRYEITTAGTSAGSEPTWPTTIGATVADNTAVWTCVSNDADLQFAIVPGAIAFALGDQFAWSIEAARYRTRKDGGSWTAAADIPTSPVVLSDGLSITFTPGVSPSWVANDRWTFAAEAVNGVDNLRQPTDDRFAWSTSTAITVTPSGTEPISGILIADHLIPSNAVITLLGSDDNFATSPLSQVITWRAGNIWQAVTGSRAKYRLTIDQAGSVNWLWLGEPLELEMRNGNTEPGKLVKRIRLPSAVSRSGQGGTIEHEAISSDSFDDFMEMIEHACTTDDRRFGIAGAGADGIVTLDEDQLEASEIFAWQPTDASQRLINVTLSVSPIA